MLRDRRERGERKRRTDRYKPDERRCRRHSCSAEVHRRSTLINSAPFYFFARRIFLRAFLCGSVSYGFRVFELSLRLCG